jgi:GT2 family glycosyltransferase
MIGLGISTYNRPDYFARCINSVQAQLFDVADFIFVYNDGSDKKYAKQYKEIYKILPEKIKVKHSPINKGVAHAKNYLLKRMMESGCDYMFLLEDDILVKSPKAITEYVRLSDESGIEHFLFAHHGTENDGKLYMSEKGIDLYTACIGAYCMYTRNVIERVGYFDENFMNAFEHVEHTFRVARLGLTTPFPTYPDLTNSRDYLEEIPGSIDDSSIRPRKDWLINVANALLYWASKDRGFPFRDKLNSLLEEMEA